MWPRNLALLASVAHAFPSQRPPRPDAESIPGQWPRPGSPRPDAKSVAYFLENDPNGSNLVPLQITAVGHLSDPTRIPTGGVGSLMVNATGFPNTADTLGSQGSLVVSENYLFTVNAGSNTLSMFAIDEQDPLHPSLVGSPVDTLGEFPISVDYSPGLRQACVLHGGAVAGVSCFSVDAKKGLVPSGPLRELPGNIIDGTTPPSGPPGSAAQVLFDPSSTALCATIKGNAGSVPPKLGSFAAWPGDPVVTQISDIFVNSGFTFVDDRKIFLSDPSLGASILTVQENLTIAEEIHVVIPGQVALCWTQYWQPAGTLYAIDAGTHDFYTLSANTGALESPIVVLGLGTSANITGLFDSAIKDGFMYSLTDVNGISVTSLTEKSLVQYLDLEGFGKRQYYMSMATWPSW